MLLTAALLAPALHAAERWFSLRGKPDFADVQQQLQVVVNEHARQLANRFCVVGEEINGSPEAWVYWPENNKPILWRPDWDNPHAIAGSNRYLDLKHDVVEGDDVHGSTYRLTRTTANQTIQACKQHGDVYTIEKQDRSDTHG